MNENERQEETMEEALAELRAKGLQVVEDTLQKLHEVGAIDGFAYVLDNVNTNTYEAAGCCAAHMADMLDPEILMDSPHLTVRAALAARMQRDISRIQRRQTDAPESMLSALQSLGFRTVQVEGHNPSEERSEPSDETLGEGLRRMLGIGDDPFEALKDVTLRDSGKMDEGYL